jgi:hypothetical protein
MVYNKVWPSLGTKDHVKEVLLVWCRYFLPYFTFFFELFIRRVTLMATVKIQMFMHHYDMK